MRLIIQLSVCIGASLVGAIAWWRMWFYHGWFGSPEWLPKLLNTDGESSYRIIMVEMFMICLLVSLVILVCLRKIVQSTK